MRLLYITADPGVPVLGHKGASVHVRELTLAFERLGVEIVIASPRTEPAGDSLDASIPLFPIPPVVSGASESVLRSTLEVQRAAVRELARTVEVEAVYERYSLFSDAGVRAAAALGVTHVLEVNAPLRLEAHRFRTLPHPSIAAKIERVVFQGTDRLLAVSPALKSWLESTGVEPERVEVVPNAVDAERFGPRRERHDGAFVVGFCGSLKAWHGIEVMLEACATAFAAEPSLRLHVIGGGPLEHLLRGAPLEKDRLVVHGFATHDEVVERLAGWDAGAAPYLPLDGFYFSPLKVLEYMATGLCPIASALGEIPALLGRGYRGVLVPAGDPGSLATALIALARNRPLAAELGRRARQHVLEAHTWERNARIALTALRGQPRELAA